MKINRSNQYDTLKSCLLCYPAQYRITSKSNKFFNKVDYTLAQNQYNKYINYLIEEGVKPLFIDLVDSSKQVYAKDVSFVIDNVLFISKMSLKERSAEIEPLKKLAIEEKLDYYVMNNNIEGGDVSVADKEVFVGVSSRTNMESIEELKKALKLKGIDKEVVPINFDKNMLHLDCVFSVLGKESALVSPYVYDRDIIEKYIKNIIEVTKEEAEGFATNFVYLGDKRLVTSNISFGKKLESLGYKVKILDFSEIVKGEGSMDCCTLDLYRE